MPEQNLTFAGCYYSHEDQDVLKPDGSRAGLRLQSVEVFRYLAQNCERVVSRNELSENVWAKIEVTDDSLTKCISEIRRALGDSGKQTLITLPKRGYQLIADELPTTNASPQIAANPSSPKATAKQSDKSYARLFLLLLPLLAVAFYYLLGKQEAPSDTTLLPIAEESRSSDDGIPSLAISWTENNDAKDFLSESLIPELRVALSRYQTINLISSEDTSADINLQIRHDKQSDSIITELLHKNTDQVLFAESYDDDEYTNTNNSASLARRLSASIASPGVGAVDKYLLESSKLIPAEELSKAACYAHGYGCSKCSGEEDSITPRAEVCLKTILEQDPNDARAWALQATIHAHQYWWANTLPEPIRSDPALRTHLPAKAIAAANKAEELSDGKDTAVYWGMAEAYYAACEADKLKTSIDRGLEINPHDPNLMGAFGNWLAYSGKWDEGAALTLKALEIEPRRYRKWWWMGPAKAAYFKDDYEQAYEYFLKAFNERNWMSHLQLAYTLPYLDRLDDARKSAKTLQYMYPGFTREKAIEIYDLLCFPDSFLEKIDTALKQAGLPSRGSSEDLSNISLPRAQVIRVNDVDIEFLDVGDGEPVVFVHGAFNDYRSWGHYMVPVSENHRYISYSRRYFGTQQWQDKGDKYSLDVFAEDLIQFIEALDLDQVHLVTWSSAVRTVMVAAAKRPDLMKSIVHIEPTDGGVMLEMLDDPVVKALEDDWFSRFNPVAELLNEGDEEGALKKLYETVFEKPSGSYELEREVLREVTRQNARTLPINMPNFENDNITLTCDYVSTVEVPTLYVYGEETHGYWRRMTARFKECSPNSLLVGIEGVNHYAPLQKIDEVSELIINFVSANR